ncbi:hypothetical protein B0H19DRAFT_964886 [Mycena capillaripes]|nr:hypothetical protein B0H19DRAFT_964886 [Mycena capillaripes]
MDKVVDLRSKCPHFRVLIIGRANAGKTTLLKKVCNSIDDPQIFSPSGRKRGLHDIENQLIFKSNPQFIFHDSRGFESGSIDEAKKVKDFIARRAGSNRLSEHLHAIWYCFPTDTNRPLLKADEDFFDTNVPGKVPLIAIFTKFDGLLTKAFNRLKANGASRMEAKNLQAHRAQEILNTDFIAPLMSTKFCPSAYVRLDDMRKETSNCMDLIEKTANALTDDTLKLLFVSVQQNNIDLCIQFAVKALVDVLLRSLTLLIRYPNRGVDTRANLVLPLEYILLFFPHIWVTILHIALAVALLTLPINCPEGRC